MSIKSDRKAAIYAQKSALNNNTTTIRHNGHVIHQSETQLNPSAKLRALIKDASSCLDKVPPVELDHGNVQAVAAVFDQEDPFIGVFMQKECDAITAIYETVKRGNIHAYDGAVVFFRRTNAKEWTYSSAENLRQVVDFDLHAST